MALNFSFVLAGGFICVSVLLIVMADNRNTANFKKVICSVHDTSYVSNVSCFAKPIDRYKTVASVYAFVKHRADVVKVNLQLFKKFNVVYKLWLVNATEDFCKMFPKSSRSSYTKMLLDMAGKYSNLNHTCPYEGWFIIKDLPLDLSKLRLFMPPGGYRLDIKTYLNNNHSPVTTMQFYAEVGEKLEDRISKIPN